MAHHDTLIRLRRQLKAVGPLDSGQELHLPKIQRERTRVAAVLVPLFVRDGQLQVFYTRRSDALSSHQGQVAFPGGKVDSRDRHLLQTALREANEEVGIEPAQVDVLGALPVAGTRASGFEVAPFVGVIDDPVLLRPDPREVAEVFSVPLAILRDSSFRATYRWQAAGGAEYPAILYGGQVIWGLTLRITESLLALL